ncbi:MAG: trigger factor [Candidatus Omnitrophota bacterium]
MTTEVKKLDNSRVEISIEVIGDVVKNKFEDVFKKIGQEAKVSGFRPGHAPRDILEKNFSHLANEQVLKELVPDAYDQAIKEHSLKVVGLPDISGVKLERGNLSFKAVVEIFPEINLKNYKGIKINYKKIEVSGEDVKRGIDALKESKKADVIDDNFARALGYPDTAELEKAVEKQIFIQQENQRRQKIENEIVQSLTADLDFKIPESLVKHQKEDLLKQAKIDLAMRGFAREKIEEQEKEMTKNLEPVAKNQVKVYLIFAEIAKRENIVIDEHMSNKVMELLLKEADWTSAA